MKADPTKLKDGTTVNPSRVRILVDLLLAAHSAPAKETTRPIPED